MKRKDDVPIERQLFRYWIELRDLRDDTMRELPVTFLRRISLTAESEVNAQPPAELRLRVQDVGRAWEASDVEDLARWLCERYPDGAFERSLHRERDLAAEEKHWSAIEELARIVARAAMRQIAKGGTEK